jgi:hypothetical protein
VIENGINAQVAIGLRASLKSDFVVSLWLKLERFDIKAESISINNQTYFRTSYEQGAEFINGAI